MKKIIVLTTATALLSSCGIYTKYQPAETTPDNLYGEEVAVDDTTNFGNVNWRELFITVMTKLLDTDREDCMIVNFHMSHIRKLFHMKNCTMEH